MNRRSGVGQDDPGSVDSRADFELWAIRIRQPFQADRCVPVPIALWIA